MRIQDLIDQEIGKSSFNRPWIRFKRRWLRLVNGGCITIDGTKVTVWIEGDCNPNDWMTDEVINHVDLAEPGSGLETIVDSIMDLERIYNATTYQAEKNWVSLRKEIQKVSINYYHDSVGFRPLGKVSIRQRCDK